MLAVFALRLAAGLIGSLLLLNPAQVNPRFFRAHFLTALGLAVLALILLGDLQNIQLAAVLAAAMGLALLGSVVWMLERAPAGRAAIVLTGLALAAALVLARIHLGEGFESDSGTIGRSGLGWLLADDFTSAALLGTATTAMLIGHSYLIAPAMSLTPLLRLLKAVFVCVLLRMGLAVAGLWHWTAGAGPVTLEITLWLIVRWGVGFVAPLGLGWMAWETAKIRSTQSATGILYIAVVFCFLGELTGQLLLEQCGFPL
jgi:hypothetical protein